MYAVKIGVGTIPEMIEMKSFDFDKVAEEIRCEWIEPIDVYVGTNHYVVLADDSGKNKKDFTYTGFRGGRNPLTGKTIVDPLVNTFLIVKTRHYKGELRYSGLNDKDVEILNSRIMVVNDPSRGHNEDQAFLNFTNLSNDDLAKEMNN